MAKEDKKRCGVCEIPYFERNNYYYGKLMTVHDFFKEQRYFNEKRWLINRMILGWGVGYGLDVKRKPIDPNDPSKGYDDKKVMVTPGLAIDCCGREILVCEEQAIQLIPEESECHKEKIVKEEGAKELIVCLEYHECKAEPVGLPPIACDQKEKGEFNRIRDSFKIRVIPYKEAEPRTPFCPQSEEERKKSLHQYLCDRLREGCPGCSDLQCVILAVVTLDEAGNIKGEPDACSKRKLVYNNPLLYDLINCFHEDLPHIIGINWLIPYNGSMEWATFENIVRNEGLQVTFDRDMKADTLTDKTFLFSVKQTDPDTGYYKHKNIPPESESIAYDSSSKKATFKVNEKWINDVFEGSSPIQAGAEFFVILRGDHIMDGENKKALDGNFIGGILPSGNGTQGGDFVSWFSVEPKPETEKGQRKRK